MKTAVFTQLRNALRLARLRRAQRRELLHLDDRLLRDIGLSREDAIRAGRKPFWRA